VYTPPGYKSSRDSFNLILFHDGLDYINLAQTVNVLDNLIAQQRIQPCIALFVPPVKRTREYAGNLKESFSFFIITDVMEWAEKKYRIRKHPENHAVLGASNGGNISLWLGYHYPHIFGKIGAQSSYVEEKLSDAFLNGNRLDLKIYLDMGKYDIPALIPLVKHFCDVLDDKGYEYVYREIHEGHSWGNWKAHLDDALEFLFPGSQACFHPFHERAE
jgi:enterochelin esterase family protein